MSLPIQRLPFNKKNDAWKKDNVDYFEKLSYSSGSSNRSSNYNKKINYDLVNGKFNKADLAYVCDPLGVGADEYPATLQHMDIISPAFNLLTSEEGSRPDNCIVLSESPTDINRKQQALKDKIMYSLQKQLEGMIDPTSIDPNNPPPTPEQIIKYDKYNISDLKESLGNKLLKHLKRHLMTKEVFKKGWKDALIAGEEIYWCGVNGNEVIFRRCNPLNMTIILDGDSDFVDDANAVIERRMLAPSTILDELGDDLKPADIVKLEEYTRRYTLGNGNFRNDPGFIYTQDGIQDTGVGSFSSTNTSGSFNSDLIRVVRVEWKSLKKLYYLTYTDETDLQQEMIVDESFNVDLFKGAYPDAVTEEFWINEAWEGIKIGDDIYVNVQPKPNQRRRLDNPYYCKLGYTGLIYNSVNSKSVSLIDRLKPYQYLYNIIWYRLELAFASDMGKVFLMDLAQIPRSEGIDIEKWMYYLRAMKMAFINSFEEGKKGSTIGQLASSKFNQFQSVDLTLANTIQQYIDTLEYIKQQTAFISGVSPQRLGAIKTDELVGNVERSVQQSAMITEYLFDSHDEVKRRTYIAMIECAKIAYKDGKKVQYILDDMGIEMLNIEPGVFDDSEFNTYMTSATKDSKVMNDIKQLFAIAIQHDKIELSTIADSLFNDSPRDLIHTIKRSEQERFAREKAQQDQLAQIEQQKVQAEQDRVAAEREDKQLDRDLKQYEVDQNNATKLAVAEIQSYMDQENLDQDNDGIPDPIEIGKLALDQQELAHKTFLEKEKSKREADKVEADRVAKERELKIKEDLENKKIEQVKVQNQSQEKMQQVQIENERKIKLMEMEAEKKRLAAEKEMHDKELKMKQKELDLKAKEVSSKEKIEKIKLEQAKQKAAADAQKHKMDMQKAKIAVSKAKQSAKPKPTTKPKK